MTAISPVTDLTLDGDVAVVTLNSPPVNALSAKVRAGLFDAFKAAEAQAAAKSIVLICDGRTFIAGADISELGGVMADPQLAEVQALIEAASKPVIAAIHGTALGGGLEVALCAHYRVAVPSARMGLPEVNLGLLPGAGGTQRLPRIVGPGRAMQMMTSGDPAGAKDALAAGLVDELVEEGKLREGAVAFARKVVAEGRPLRRVRDQNEKVEAARGKPEIFADFRKANAERFRGFLAPEYNVRCVEAAVNQTFDEGMATERRLFGELVKGPQSAAQRYGFFAERQVAKVPGLAADAPVTSIQKVTVAGAGPSAAAIAAMFTKAGLAASLIDPLKDDLASLAEADLVLLTGHDDLAAASALAAKLDAVCKPGAILAVDTEDLDLDQVAAATGRPQAVIGFHIFSPAAKLVEVVRGARTSDGTIATAMKLAKSLGKIAALVKVGPGFVAARVARAGQSEARLLVEEGAKAVEVARVLYDFGLPKVVVDASGASDSKIADEEIRDRVVLRMINEAAKLLDEGKAIRASDIDMILQTGSGWPAYRGGALHYGEHLGLPAVAAKLDAYAERLGERFKPSPLITRLAAEGGTFAA